MTDPTIKITRGEWYQLDLIVRAGGSRHVDRESCYHPAVLAIHTRKEIEIHRSGQVMRLSITDLGRLRHSDRRTRK